MRLSFAALAGPRTRFRREAAHHNRRFDIGLPSGRVISGAKAACRTHRLTHDVLQASEVERRYPAWRLPPEFEAVHQPDAGFLPADRAIVAHVTLSRRLGADVRVNEVVTGWKAIGDRVEVETERGSYEAGSLVLAAGAWTSKLLDRFKELAIPQRQVVGWSNAGPQLHPESFPVLILDCPERGNFYGFPNRQRRFQDRQFRHRRRPRPRHD